jgi:hypothetical protein
MSSAPGRHVTTSQSPLGDWLRDPEVEVIKRPERRAVILRRIDLWSALKVSLALYFSIFVVFLIGAVLLWLGARSAGLIDNIETLVEDLGFAGRGRARFPGHRGRGGGLQRDVAPVRRRRADRLRLRRPRPAV